MKALRLSVILWMATSAISASWAAEPAPFFGAAISPVDPALTQRFQEGVVPPEISALKFNITANALGEARPKVGREGSSGFHGKEYFEHLGGSHFFNRAAYSFRSGMCVVTLDESFSRETNEPYPVNGDSALLAFDWLAAALGEPDGFAERDLRKRLEGVEHLVLFWRKPEADFQLSFLEDEDYGLRRTLDVTRPDLERLPPRLRDAEFKKLPVPEIRTKLAEWLTTQVKLPPQGMTAPEEVLVAAPPYEPLIGEGLQGSGFHFAMPDGRRFIACSLHQFEEDAPPKVMGHMDFDEPIKISGRASKGSDFQVLTYESAELDKREPLKFDSQVEAKTGDTVYVYPGGAPLAGKVTMTLLLEISVEFPEPFLAAGMSGSPVVLGRSGTVIGVLTSADSPEEARKGVCQILWMK